MGTKDIGALMHGMISKLFVVYKRIASLWSRPSPIVVREPEASEPSDVVSILPASPKAARQPSLRPIRTEIENTVNDIINMFYQASKLRLQGAPSNARRANGTYILGHNDLWNCDFHFMDELAERMEGGGKFYYVTGEGKEQAEAVWPIDVAAITLRGPRVVTTRISTTTASEIRGKVKIVPSKVLILSSGGISPENGWWAENHICGLIANHWRDIGDKMVTHRISGVSGDMSEIYRSGIDPKQVSDTIGIMLSCALTERYAWHVAFGVDSDGPRILLPTNPAGCLALFRDREKGNKEQRRAALRHWVSNHYRDDDRSKADIIYVRDHLRGCTNFEWRGLQCELLVSQYDLEKNDFFRLQADQWRSQRKHNRVRLRIKNRAVA